MLSSMTRGRGRLLTLVLALSLTAGLTACERPPEETPISEVRFLCYVARTEVGVSAMHHVTAQFGTEIGLNIRTLNFVCEPVHKKHSRNQLPAKHPNWFPLTCYGVEGSPRNIVVDLTDQFHPENEVRTTVKEPRYLCDPVRSKVLNERRQPGDKFPFPTLIYKVTPQVLPNPPAVFTLDEFGVQAVTPTRLEFLMEPAVKNERDEPPEEKPWTCYLVNQNPLMQDVEFTDQFNEDGFAVTILQTYMLCDPAVKTIVDE
ncbi:hypothetical protein [Nitratireductor sp. XY-223]|uniref:hypothetical protein n=1 Tax=Nitratireductor sp. XY-223 TaxID=2561926 RepID=UPI0010AAB220|nr:hypothetical protein [Nitratireductor sp. XY-223]